MFKILNYVSKYNKLEIILFLGILLSYPIQVVTMSYWFSYLVYGSIFIYILFYIKNFNVDNFYYSKIDKLLIIFFLLILFNIIRELMIYKNWIDQIRFLILYFFPILFIYIIIYSKSNATKILYNAILIVGVIVSLELFIEFFSYDISYFENKHFEYVKNITGKELFQFLGPLRNNGIMDHIHVSAVFIAFSLIITINQFIFYKKTLDLFLIFLVSIALVLIGVRLILIYSVLLIICFFYTLDNKNKIKLLKINFLILLAIIGILFITYDYKAFFWSAIYLQYLPKEILDFLGIYETVITLGNQNDSFQALQIIPVKDDLIEYSNNKIIFNFLFGTGFNLINSNDGYLTDDLFFLQLFFSLGILNSVIFISIIIIISFLNAIKEIYNNSEIFIWLSILIIISLSLLHSGVFIRKQVFILFFLAVLIIDYFNKIKNIKENYVNYNNR